MSQTSRLSIVVDTQQAKQKLIDFTAQLKIATTQATNLATQLRAPMGAAGANTARTSLAGLTAQAAKAQLQQDKLTQSAAKTAIQQQKLAQEVIKTSIAQNNLARSAQAVVIGNQRAEASARRAASGITALSSATNTLNRNWANINLSARTFTPATAAARALSVQINSVTAAAARVAPAANSAAAGLNNLQSASERANRSGRGLHGTMNKLYTVLNSGLVAVTGLGFIKTAAEMQNLNNQIRLVTDSEREYIGMKQLAGKIADENFADINATINLYQKSVRALENLGKSQADSIKFTEAVSLAMRTGGRSAGENAAAILQLGQAMGAGVIMGDEFRSISENAPVLLKLVAKEMGVLQGDLKKLSADGKITAEIMYNAMTKNMAELEQLAKKMPLTMGQAFVVAKNNYKKYTDELMNSTGGVSDKISGMLVKISANFDTIAKVGIAGMVLGLVSVTASIVTATNAMKLFNLVTSANPLMLMVSGFLLLTSAIFGTNEVLTISGIMLGDFFDGMSTMLKDGEKWWMDFSNTVAVAMGLTVKEVAEANDKNSKNFLGFYEETEKGFAGVVQGLGTAIGSVTAIFGTFFELLGRWTDNMFTIFENMGKAAYNAGNRVRMLFGGEDQQQEYGSLKSLDGWSIYKNTFNINQDSARSYAQGLNQRAGITPAPLDKGWSNPLTRRLDMTNLTVVGKNTVLKPEKATIPEWLIPKDSNFRANANPINPQSKLAYETKKIREEEEERLKVLKKQDAELKKQAKSTELVRLAVVGGKNWGISQGGGYGGARGHNGIDLPTPVGTQVYAPESGTIKAYGDDSSRGGKQLILIADSGKKYGFAHLDSYDVKNGSRVDAGMGIAKSGATGTRPNGKGYSAHLHLTVTDANGKKVDPTSFSVGKTKYDNTIGSYNAKAQSEAEKQREKEAREAEKRLQARLKIDKEYATKRELISLQLNEKLLEIREAGYDDATAKTRGDQAVAEANREMAIYEETLARRIDALDDFHQTERYKLQQERDNAVFDALHNQDLLQAGNEQYLKYEIEAANRLYKHKESLLNLSQEEEALGLFEYASTDRRMFEEGWRLKIARAKLATDELKDIRIKAYEAEYAKDQELFNLNEKKKLLSLREDGMGAGEYMLANERLNIQGINNSNMTPEMKYLEIDAARKPLSDAMQGVMDGINQESPVERIRREHEEKLEILGAYEARYTDLVGTNSAERLAIEKSYQDAKFALVTDSGASLFGALGGLAKDMLGQQSQTYRVLFAIEKGFYIAQSVMAIQASIAKATAIGVTPFDKAFYIAEAVTTGVGILSQLKAVQMNGFEKGGYTGNMGASQVAGVVHGQEYVFDAQSTKRIGVDNLNAMRRGENPNGGGDVIINNYSSAKIEQRQDANGVTILDVRDEIKRSWTNTGNPNSFESKQLNRNIQAPRRR